MPHGFLLVDKPAGITSHDVIDRLRKITGIQTIGHAGTLDPFATGLLIVAVGKEATTKLGQFVGLDKTYDAEIRLGASSTTLDPEGAISELAPMTIESAMIEKAVAELTGPQNQIPPMHSAIKIAGQKLYTLARQGKEIDRPPRPITIHEFTLLSPLPAILHTPSSIHVRIRCSSGTYIRALARDLGEKLGTNGYLTALRRTNIDRFSVDNAAKLSELSPQNWIDAIQTNMLP